MMCIIVSFKNIDKGQKNHHLPNFTYLQITIFLIISMVGPILDFCETTGVGLLGIGTKVVEAFPRLNRVNIKFDRVTI